MNTIDIFPKKNTTEGSRCSIQTLTEEIKPMIIEKKELEYREDSLSGALLGNVFRLSETKTQARKKIFDALSPLQMQNFD